MKKEKKQFAKANCFFYNNKLTFHFMDIILFISIITIIFNLSIIDIIM